MLLLIGGRAECQACADMEARTPDEWRGDEINDGVIVRPLFPQFVLVNNLIAKVARR